MLSVDKALICSFQILKPAEKKKRNARSPFNTSKGYDHKARKEIGVILTLLNWDL